MKTVLFQRHIFQQIKMGMGFFQKEERVFQEILFIKKAVNYAAKLDLDIHAGHGLTYKSAKIISKILKIKELNIGHFLIGESIFIGLPAVIKKFQKILK